MVGVQYTARTRHARLRDHRRAAALNDDRHTITIAAIATKAAPTAAAAMTTENERFPEVSAAARDVAAGATLETLSVAAGSGLSDGAPPSPACGRIVTGDSFGACSCVGPAASGAGNGVSPLAAGF